VTVQRDARPVKIHALEVLSAGADEVVVHVACSKGTYVRTLAEDIGQALGCGACLFSLRRTRVGPFEVESAIGLPELEALAAEDRVERLRPVDTLVADLPCVALTPEQASRIEHGQAIEHGSPVATGLVRIYGPGAAFLGVGQAVPSGRIEPRRLVAARPRIG
jgi:tRNA pseudouridine55 synthase